MVEKYARSWKEAGSIPDDVTELLNFLILSAAP
jgi:hypothetical protein